MKWLKALHARIERSRVRKALGLIKNQTPKYDQGDWEDRCGHDDCDICGTQFAPDPGPNFENYPDDWKAID